MKPKGVFVDLICEGACNPNIAAIDAEVQRYPKRDVFPVGYEGLWRRQRTLVYTPHVMIQEHVAKCVECGRARVFGGGSPIPLEVS